MSDWKEQGGKILGYFCSYVPEEVITAAGFLPFRMRATGCTGTELSDGYLSDCNCSFVRSCFNMALNDEFSFLDGVVWVNSCDHVRRVFDNWKHALTSPSFLHFLGLPKKIGEKQVEWYRHEIVTFKESLEKHFGVQITDEHLWEAIRIHNKRRRLQRSLYQLRQAEHPPITGAETLAVMVASTAMPIEHYNQSLRELVNDLADSSGEDSFRARLMLLGGVLDDPNYIKVIEDQGGLVVTDMLCYGTKAMWVDVDEGTSDPATALARYYITDRPACPRFFGVHEKRVALIRELVREFKVDAVIGQRLMFCDGWDYELYMLDQDFKEDGIPHLKLEREYILGGVGQMKTRVQALLESIGR
jgi:benzoyl-CoA reductase/2-hydroxyglutaryl-CoA dehydratase subunit BcrC/BadD/HgdB